MSVITRQIKAVRIKNKMVESVPKVFAIEINWVVNNTVLVSRGNYMMFKNISFYIFLNT